MFSLQYMLDTIIITPKISIHTSILVHQGDNEH